MSWSRHGYEKASYCISQTGRKPAMQRPTAAPRIPASASGVSTHRSCPKRSRSPAVARNTPPARPTSSPMTMTDGSRSSSTWNASLIASTIESSATEHSPQLLEIRAERRRRIALRGPRNQPRIPGGLRPRPPHPRHSVADRLVGEGLRTRLRFERRRDRPLVVVAKENERRTGDRREVGALVERPFGGGTVPEERDRACPLALQLLSPRE